MTTREAAWYIISVVFVCMCQKFIFAHAVYLYGIQVKFVYEGHRVSQGHRSNNGPESLFAQCKTSMSQEVCVQHGVFGYGGTKVVTAIFVT